MRENGTIGEKDAASDQKVWQIISKIRALEPAVLPQQKAEVEKLVSRLEKEYNFKWDRYRDEGSYIDSGVVYDAGRNQVADHRTPEEQARHETMQKHVGCAKHMGEGFFLHRTQT